MTAPTSYRYIIESGEKPVELLPIGWRWPKEASLGPVSTEIARGFCEQMLSGVAFPAVNAVLGRNGRFCVVDGCHRLAASLLAGFGWLPVIVVGETAFYPSVRSDGSWVA